MVTCVVCFIHKGKGNIYEMGVGGQHHTLAALRLGKGPGTHCTGGWVGPRAGLDGCGKIFPHQDLIPGLSST